MSLHPHFSRASGTHVRAFAIASLLVSLSSVGWAQAPRPRPIPYPPSGYDFPIPASSFKTWIQNRDEAAMRRHSWYLWAGINQPGRDGWPIWASWNTATQVFAPSPKLGTEQAAPANRTPSLVLINKANRANVPINLDGPYYVGASLLSDGDAFQNNGDVMLVTEACSQIGYDWIRRFTLFERATLDALQASGRSDIPAMPSTSIVLKHMYWPVKKDGLTGLPIVDMSAYEISANPLATYLGFENQKRWSRAVAIDPSRTSIPTGETARVTYLHDVLEVTPTKEKPTPPVLGPLTYDKAKVVPISDFYFKKLSISEFKAMSVADQRLIDASFYWAHKRGFQDGDYLVSIASHIVTKEQPEWTLQTLWWSDAPNETKYAKDRPSIPQAKGPWQHYLLATEDGIATDGKVPIAYNPYIELAAAHPVDTNCRNCHMRADVPGAEYITKYGPGALDELKFRDPIFAGKMRTDFLWTIVDRALPVPAPPQP